MNPSVRPVMVLVALALLPCSAVRAQPDGAEPAAPVDAVWLELQRNLVYFGQTTYYSCYGLRDKVRYILKQVGARSDLKVTTSCVESGGVGIETMPSVRIKAAFPTAATPEVLARLAAEAPKRELVKRVKGRAGPDAETGQFPAVWRRVEFDGSGRGRIADGDCELLEHLLEQVLVPAGVRVAPESRLSCMRGHVPTGSVRLVLDTLQKASRPDEGPGTPPG